MTDRSTSIVPAAGTDERVITTDSGAVVAANLPTIVHNVGVPTQVANPFRTTIRTIVQNLVILIPLANAVLVVLRDYLQEQTELGVPPEVFLIVNGGIIITGFIIGLVARFMATPGVADFIARRLPWLAPNKPAA